MRRRAFVYSTAGVFLTVFGGCVGSVPRDLSTATADDIRERAESPTYDELYRNVDYYRETPVHLIGRVMWFDDRYAAEHEFVVKLREERADTPGSLLRQSHEVYTLWNGSPFRQGDVIEIWGYAEGLTEPTAGFEPRVIIRIVQAERLA